MPEFLYGIESSRVGVFDGQSSSNNMTVMAGCGSSMSSGPQTAVNLTSREARLPDNLKASMSDATQHPSVSSLNHFCECKRRCLAGRELLFGVQKMWWKIPKYFLLLAGSRFKHGSSSFTVRICVALAAIQTTGKPAIFKGISQRQAKARPSGRRLVLSLRGALAGCLLWEHGVCASLGFCGKQPGIGNES
jgi:hypothetical protein